MMAKSGSTNENMRIGSVELFIIETLLKGENVVIPDIGHLELNSFGGRRTVLFKPTVDTDLFLRVMSLDGDKERKEDEANIYNILSAPLKAGEVVNLPKIGIFKPTKRENNKIHVSFTLSSSLRSMLNEKEGEPNKETKDIIDEAEEVKSEVTKEVKTEIDEIKALPETSNGERIDLPKTDVREIADKASIAANDIKSELKGSLKNNGRQLKQNSNLVDTQKNVQTNRASTQIEDKPSKKRSSSLGISGILLLVAAAAILAWIVVSVISSRATKETEEKTELILLPSSESISLPALAEQHYGNSAFWVYIYKANKDKLESPVNIPKNVSLVYPDLKIEYDVDVSDSLAIRKANILAGLLLERASDSDNNVTSVTPAVNNNDNNNNNEK